MKKILCLDIDETLVGRLEGQEEHRRYYEGIQKYFEVFTMTRGLTHYVLIGTREFLKWVFGKIGDKDRFESIYFISTGTRLRNTTLVPFLLNDIRINRDPKVGNGVISREDLEKIRHKAIVEQGWKDIGNFPNKPLYHIFGANQLPNIVLIDDFKNACFNGFDESGEKERWNNNILNSKFFVCWDMSIYLSHLPKEDYDSILKMHEKYKDYDTIFNEVVKRAHMPFWYTGVLDYTLELMEKNNVCFRDAMREADRTYPFESLEGFERGLKVLKKINPGLDWKTKIKS